MIDVSIGCTLLVGSRDLGRGEEAAKQANGRALQLDATNQASVTAAAERIRKELGRLDVLVNNAAISNTAAPDAPFEQIMKAGAPSVASLDEVRAVFETNVFGVIAVTQAMLPLLREAPSGRIVNVSSTVGSLTEMSKPTNPWRMANSSGRDLLRGIVGFELLAEKIELKFKLNQNHVRGNIEGAIAGLSASNTPDSVSVAGLMQEVLKDK